MTRNIVFLVLDTVRKDYFDKYSPRLRARSEMSFSECRAVSSWSVPSHASIFTGLLPYEHGIHSESFDADFDFGAELKAETFLEQLSNYETFGVSSNIYINREFGFDSLFGEFKDHSIGNHWNAFPFPEGKTHFDADSGSIFTKYGNGVVSAFKDEYPLRSMANGIWLLLGNYLEDAPLPRLSDNGAKANAKSIVDFSLRTEEPFFAFGNFMDAHNPLQNSRLYDQSLHTVPNSWSSNELDKWEILIDQQADDEYKNNYRELYGAAIDYLDKVVLSMIDEVESQTEYETTFIITADHGHNLGYGCEQGHFHHTASLSEGVLHVPLEIINPPADWPDHISERTSQTHLFELIESIANSDDEPVPVQKEPVVAENIGLLGEGTGISYSGATLKDEEYWNRMIRCGYLDSEKYEWDSLGTRKRFRVERDSPCSQSLLETDIDIPRELLSCFRTNITSYKEKTRSQEQKLNFDDEVVQNLQDLGYL